MTIKNKFRFPYFMEDEELGLQKRCGRCKEYYPADREFFHHQGKGIGGLHSYCKACVAENREKKKVS